MHTFPHAVIQMRTPTPTPSHPVFLGMYSNLEKKKKKNH